MRLSNQEMHFFSFGFYHHDLCLVKHHKLKMDNNSMLHFTLVARDKAAFDGIRARAAAMGIPVRDGRLIASAKTLARPACLLSAGSRQTLDRDHRGATPMTAVAYVPPNALPPLLQKFAPLLKRKWFREFVLLPPTMTRRRFSNKTEDYGVFKPSQIDHSFRRELLVHLIDHLVELTQVHVTAEFGLDDSRVDSRRTDATPAMPPVKGNREENVRCLRPAVSDKGIVSRAFEIGVVEIHIGEAMPGGRG